MILLVDDEVEICIVMKTLIEEVTEHKVVTANNTTEALTVIESESPQLLITDIKMPGRDGLWLVDQVRTMKLQIPVIVMSGFTTATPEEIESRALDAFIQKPDEMPKIIDFIEKLLD